MFEGNLHKSLEREINYIESEVSKNKEKIESDLEKKKTVKETLRSIPKHVHSDDDASNEESNTSPSSLLPDYVEEGNVDDNTKLIIEKLLDMTFHKGIYRTIKASKKYPPFIQDAFHDALVDKILPRLEKKNLFK